MVEQATQIPDPLIIDKSRLNLFPDPAGMQHCEICSVLDLCYQRREFHRKPAV